MRSVSTKHVLMAVFLLSSLYLNGTYICGQGIEKRGDADRLGSADKLSGNVYSLAIFISTPQNSWSQQDKWNEFLKQKETEEWMVAQAKRYGVRLEFKQGSYGLNDEVISVPYIPSFDRKGNGSYKTWAAFILHKLGFKDPLDLWSWLQNNTNCNNLHIIIYANTTGVSHAVPFKIGIDNSSFFIEASIVYRYNESKQLLSSTIAHEVLHLYGAWDLYNSREQKRDVESEARRLFPDDIMHRISFKLSELQVDKLTAWRIGWSDKKEPWYESFRPIE